MKEIVFSIIIVAILGLLGIETKPIEVKEKGYNYDNIRFAETYLDSLKQSNKQKFIGSIKKVDSFKTVVKIKDKTIVRLKTENMVLKDTLSVLRHDTIKQKNWLQKLLKK